MAFDVFGMCNALFDLQAEVEDAVLEELGLAKGGVYLIDEAQQRSIVERVYQNLVNAESGGSGANTMFGVALLGGKACYTSRVGDDEHADLYRQGLAGKGVKPNLGSDAGVTGISVVLVTPDAQRTMCTFLGKSRDLTADDVNLADLRRSKYLYVTGYLWDTENQKRAVLRAMQEANRAGVKVALSLSDPFCVDRHKPDFLELLREHVDLVFGNATEAQALTETDNPRAAASVLAQYCDIAVVTRDEKGSLIQRKAELHEIAAYPVTPVDTTGAGDMFAAGILYGITQGLPLNVTGRIASYCAACVVARMGPRLEALDAAAIARLRGGAALDEV